ncbi:MAG: hypothetical protein JW889_04380 [Verrucomicrobia bacterium]|nr:hypothetical protein [Verrucomicrobiota bacterium]
MDWQIQTRAKACATCGTLFREGDAYHCLLAEAADGLARSDYCTACWDKTGPELLKAPAAISTWHGTVPPKLVPPEETIKRTTAESLLAKYLHSTSSEEKSFCFILGLILERKRILRQRQVMHDEHRGAKLVVYEHARSGESYVIEDPGLSLTELEKIHGQVAAILEREKVSAS